MGLGEKQRHSAALKSVTVNLAPANYKQAILSAAKKASARGWESEGDLGQIMGEIRRDVSVSVVRAHSLCLLEWLAYLGPGARTAGQC